MSVNERVPLYLATSLSLSLRVYDYMCVCESGGMCACVRATVMCVSVRVRDVCLCGYAAKCVCVRQRCVSVCDRDVCVCDRDVCVCAAAKGTYDAEAFMCAAEMCVRAPSTCDRSVYV